MIAGAADFLLMPVTAAAGAITYTTVTAERVADGWVVTAVLAATLFVGGFERIGGYRLNNIYSMKWQITHEIGVWAVTVSCLLLVAFVERRSAIYSRAWALSWMAVVPAGLAAKSYFLRLALAACNRSGYFARNVVIIGAGAEGRRLIETLRQSGDKSIAICGVFDDGRLPPPSVCGVRVLGTTDDLLSFARAVPVDEVIVALPLDAKPRLKELCNKMKALAIDVRLSIAPLAELFEVNRTGYVGGIPVIEVVDRPLKNWRGAVKWAEDKLIAGILLAILAPVMLGLALLIKLDTAGPVFFGQRRFGFNNEVIRVLKFRTMRVDLADPSGARRTIAGDPRVTRLGRVLRRLSLDELPQLINVIRGDMSLVGPRPHAVMMQVGERLYGDAVAQYLHRHRVKPGITGWAQVNGLRGEVDTLEKGAARVAYDIHYIENWSLWLDLKILLRTVAVVCAGEGAW